MNIFKLIKKDFRAHWAYQLDGMVLLFAISTLFIYIMLQENSKADPELIIYFMVMLLSTSIVSLLFITIDELYKIDEIFVSLPVTRTEIVIAKYSSSFIQVLLALPVHFLGVQLAIFFNGSLEDSGLEVIYNPILWLSMGGILLFFKSYAFPLYFKFGLAIGAAIHIGIQFLLLVILILSFQLFNLRFLIEKLIEWSDGQNEYLLFTAIAVAFISLMSFSIALSSKLYKNKSI